MGAGLLLAGLPPAHAETAPDGSLSDRPAAQQDQLLQQAGMDQDDVARAEALAQLSHTTDAEFYATPAQLPAKNGDVIRQESSTFYLDPLKKITPNAESTRILYKTVNSKGQEVAASGTVLKSKAKWRKSTPRPLVAMAPGTQGVGDSCAPSRQLALGTEYEGIELAGLVNAGYNVVVPDYIGLGTEGVHTYMNRVDQAHAVLDGIRAAQRTGTEGVTAKTPVATVGYSQGGGATASAIELAPEYAPEIDIKSAWVGAPPAELAATAKHFDSKLFSGLTLYAVAAAQDSGVQFREKLNADGQKRFDAAQQDCVITTVFSNALVQTKTLTKDGRSFTQMLPDEDFAAYIKEQENGVAGRHPRVPVRLAHSLTDDVVPYSVGRDLAKKWCASGSNVSMQTLATPTHLGGYVVGVPAMLTYLDARFNGIPQVNSCWRL